MLPRSGVWRYVRGSMPTKRVDACKRRSWSEACVRVLSAVSTICLVQPDNMITIPTCVSGVYMEHVCWQSKRDEEAFIIACGPVFGSPLPIHLDSCTYLTESSSSRSLAKCPLTYASFCAAGYSLYMVWNSHGQIPWPQCKNLMPRSSLSLAQTSTHPVLLTYSPSGRTCPCTQCADLYSLQSIHHAVRLRGSGSKSSDGAGVAIDVPYLRQQLLQAVGWSEDADTTSLLLSLGLTDVQVMGLRQTIAGMIGCNCPSSYFILSSSMNGLVSYILKALPMVEASSRSPCAIFMFTGEGAHAQGVDINSLRQLPSWAQMEVCIQRLGISDNLASFLHKVFGAHSAPHSPILTTVVNILNADRWRLAGYEPNVVVGHSIGEVAAAHVAGMLTMFDAVRTAFLLGRIGAALSGYMLHTVLPKPTIRAWTDMNLCLAAINGRALDGRHVAAYNVTLCGTHEHIKALVATDSQARMLRPPHPWHHLSYQYVPDLQQTLSVVPVAMLEHAVCRFVSCVNPEPEVTKSLDADYWRTFCTSAGAS